jgi:hypothetical protein
MSTYKSSSVGYFRCAVCAYAYKEVNERFERDRTISLQEFVVDDIQVFILELWWGELLSFVCTLNQPHRVHNPEAGQRGGHLELIESIRLVFIKVPERGFKLFNLRRRKVCHIAGYNL